MPSSRSYPGLCRDLVGTVLCPTIIRQDRKITWISNTCRSYTLLGVLIALSMIIGLPLWLAKYYPARTIKPVPDQMYFVDWFSNVWCATVNVTTDYPLRVNAYVVDTADKDVCKQTVQSIKGPLSATVQGGEIFTISLRLNQGDRISAKICMSRGMGKIYMFARNIDFLRCILSDSWTQCGLRGPYRWEIEAACTDYDNFDNPYLLPPQSITNDGEYFFVLYNRGSIPAPASIVFTKTIPNIHLQEQAQVSCLDKTLCKFDLGGTSESQAVCFEAVRRTSLPGRDSDEVKVTCGDRQWVYILLFLLFPIFASIVGAVLICSYCDKKKNEVLPGLRMDMTGSRNIPTIAVTSRNVRENDHQFDNVSEFRNYNHDTSRGSVTRDGPNLEPETPDRHPNFSDPPPSYDEVMKGSFV